MEPRFKFTNHNAETLEKLLKKLEKDSVPPGKIITIIDTGEDGKERWHSASWEYA